MPESQRDAGLVRAVGAWSLAASIVNIVVGAGIFAVPAALAACVGPYAPLAFVASAAVVGAVALCFAEGGSRVPTSGGAYGYVEAAFGPGTAYVAGTMQWLSDALACGGVAAALGELVAGPARSVREARRARGRRRGRRRRHRARERRRRRAEARGSSAWRPRSSWRRSSSSSWWGRPPSAPGVSTPPQAIWPAGSGRALILSVFAFTGMEASLCASGEVAEPSRTIPRALGRAMLAVTVLYVGIQVVAQGILGPALAGSTAPLADAMGRISPALKALLLVGAGLSMFGWIGSDLLGTPRMLYAFARDGLLPAVLGRVHPRTRAPHVAILTYAALAMVLALTGTFAELAVLSALSTAPLYVAGCAAAWRLARSGVAQAGEPLRARALGLAAAAGIGGMVALVALASRAEMLGLFASIALTALAYAFQKRWRRPGP